MRDEREVRRGILRRATALTVALVAAAVAMALLGSAGVAWLLLPDMEFTSAWLLVLGVVVVGVIVIVAVQALMSRRRGTE